MSSSDLKLLIGLGNMGHAHLSSFSGKKKFKFYIYDKYLSLNKATKKICDSAVRVTYDKENPTLNKLQIDCNKLLNT